MIYVGISDAGAYAAIDGNNVEVRCCDGANMFKFMDKLKSSNTRCVIEMEQPMVETAALPMSASEAAYRLCRMKELPFMVVKKGSWQRDLDITGSAKETCKNLFPGVQIEARADGISPEADALLLAEYAKRSL